MKILFIGKNYGHSKLNYKAIKSLHPKTTFLDSSKIIKGIYYHIFYHLMPSLFNNIITNFYKNNITQKYDLIFFSNVEFINHEVIKKLRKKTNNIYFYCSDNPFVNRDKKKWELIKSVISKFDLMIFHQKSREKYIKKFKIKKYVIIIPPYYKDLQFNNYKKKTNKRNICFVGTWFPERGKFFYELKKLGLEFNIYGPRWDKDKKYYKYLKDNITLKRLSINECAKIVSTYKIGISLLSKDNNDDITHRCIEIPAIGSLLCCQRTKTMKKILIENKEAIYFDTPKECFNQCKKLVNNEKRLNKISKNGNHKITKILRPEARRVFKSVLNPQLLKNQFLYKF